MWHGRIVLLRPFRLLMDPTLLAETAWTEAAASAGLSEQLTPYTRASLMRLAGCSCTLHQHAHSCARILARRCTCSTEHEGPPASTLSPGLKYTARPAEDFHAICITSLQLREASFVALPLQHPTAQIDELSFNHCETHLAAVDSNVGDGVHRNASLYIVEVDTRALTHAASVRGKLALYWTPTADMLAVCGPFSILVVSMSGNVIARHDGLGGLMRSMAWRPDSRGLLACMAWSRLLGDYTGVQASRVHFARLERATPGLSAMLLAWAHLGVSAAAQKGLNPTDLRRHQACGHAGRWLCVTRD